MSDDITWKQPANPPPPMFLGKKERDLVKQVNDELIERVIGQGIFYYPVSIEHTNYHHLYGEAINKSFLPPVRVNALVTWEGAETTNTNGYGIDRRSSITVNFHKRRLTEDQDLQVQEGDFILYGNLFYEIVSIGQPRELFGQTQHKMEIAAKCIRARDGVFEEAAVPTVSIQKYQVAQKVYINNVTTVSGSGGGGGGGSGSLPTSSCNWCVPTLSGEDTGSLDYSTLQTFADNAGDYNGYQFYLTQTGTTPVGSFTIANKWYFCENGIWYPSPFYKR